MSENPHEEFLALYKPIHEQLARFCGSHAYGIMETQDLLQETILQTMQQFTRIKNKDRLLYYMIAVASNLVKNTLRRKKFSGKMDDKKLHGLESTVSDPSLLLDIQHLYEALNKLPMKMKEAIILFEINGLSMKEIAEIQQVKEGAVKTMVSRGRDKLRVMLSENKVELELSGGKTLFTLIL